MDRLMFAGFSNSEKRNKQKQSHQKIMPTYEPADEELITMATAILNKYESHSSLLKYGVKFDFVFAHPTIDEQGVPTGDAIKKHGQKALGLCRVINLKDRTMGRGDVEILIDFDWWNDEADEHQQAALLDHELHHAEVKMKDGSAKRDNLGRPLIRLRKHDVEVGWFDIIALRHGRHSQERIQAQKLADDVGQLYWPAMCGEIGKALKDRVMAPFQVTSTRRKELPSTENIDVATP